MPIFEYKCHKCGAQFELLIRSGQTPSCPECGSKRLKKLISQFCAGSSKYNAAKACREGRVCTKSRQVGHSCPHGGGCCCGGR